MTVVPLVTDSASPTNTLTPAVTYSLTITPASQPAPLLARTLAGLYDASINVPYVAPLDQRVVGGVAPYIWTVAPSSTLPAGLGIAAGTNGVSSYLTGIPTGPAGPTSFSLMVTDSGNPAQTLTIPLTLNVSALSLTPDSLAPAVAETPYSVTFGPAGGTAPYSLQLASYSDLPPGLTLMNAAGVPVLGGTPSAPGFYLISVVLSDNAGNTFNKYFELTIDDAAGESPAVSITKPINVYYVVGSPAPSLPLNIGSTSGNLAFTSIVTGNSGASLSADSGTTPGTQTLNFSGSTLTTPGTYLGLVAVSAPGSVNLADAAPIVLTVAAPLPCVYSLNPSGGTIDAAGGTGSFTISAASSCAAWTATPSDDTVTITSGASGSGNGTINYSVASNFAPAQRCGSPRLRWLV